VLICLRVDPIAGTVLPPEPTSLRADTHTDRQASHYTALRTDKPRVDMPTR
jgi:hypothetical protein